MSEVLNIFDIKHKNTGSRARTGTLHLPHGDVRTPVFMPVGTNATVKAMPKDFLEEIDERYYQRVDVNQIEELCKLAKQ